MFNKKNTLKLTVFVFGVLAFSVALSCTTSSTGADVGRGEKPIGPYIWDYVYNNSHVPVVGADVEWYCETCDEFLESTVTNQYGAYTVGPFDDHKGHWLKGYASSDPEGTGEGEIRGYIPNITYQIDFVLTP